MHDEFLAHDFENRSQKFGGETEILYAAETFDEQNFGLAIEKENARQDEVNIAYWQCSAWAIGHHNVQSIENLNFGQNE